eukprot:GHVS01050100.1.p1 GENE.GHVS01050100.1~~GHVS01050100.1.p1  ORF type:complete len:602 (+),score=55.66 GHVS01050100.1:119-1924(+)
MSATQYHLSVVASSLLINSDRHDEHNSDDGPKGSEFAMASPVSTAAIVSPTVPSVAIPERQMASSYYPSVVHSISCSAESPPKRPPAAVVVRHTPFNMNRNILLGFYIIVMLLSGNVYLGWALGLREMMFRANAYVWVCEAGEQIPCTRQQELVGNLLVYACTGHFVFSIFAGMLLDYTGPKITACLGQSMKAAGWLLLAFASESFPSYLPAFVLIGGSCDVSNFPLFTICNIFLEKRVIPLCLMGAAAMTSTSIPLAMHATWKYLDQGPEFLVDVCVMYAGLFVGLSMLNAIFLTPWSAMRTTFEEAEGDETAACEQRKHGATDITDSTSSRFRKFVSSENSCIAGVDSEDECALYRQDSSGEPHNGKQPWQFTVVAVPRVAIEDGKLDRERSSYICREVNEFVEDVMFLRTGAADNENNGLQTNGLTAAHEQQHNRTGGPRASVDMTGKPQPASLPLPSSQRRKPMAEKERSFRSYCLDISFLIIVPYFCVAILRTTFISIAAEELFGEAYKAWGKLSGHEVVIVLDDCKTCCFPIEYTAFGLLSHNVRAESICSCFLRFVDSKVGRDVVAVFPKCDGSVRLSLPCNRQRRMSVSGHDM